MTGQGSLWFGSTEFYPETINQSLRFNGDGDLRNSSFSTPTNNQQWTWSAWIKLGAIDSGLRVLFQADTNSVDALQTNDNKLSLTVAGTAGTTTAKYRDPNAWYHVLFNYNGSNSYLYINNRLDLTLSPSGNSKFNNSSYTHFIGQNGSNARYWSGYMAEINFIDGQALDPSSFGQTKNGVWIPKNVSSLTYGNNGFRLTFADNTALGDDTSGNTNDFTVAGDLASYDVVLDSPTNNFATWNLLFKGGEQSSSIYANSTLSEGNLQVSVPTNSYMGSTFRPTSGKWYAEIRVKTMGTTNGEIDWGWLQATTYSGSSGHSGQANKWGAFYHAYSTNHIRLYDETSQLGSNINLTIEAGKILQLAWDIDNNKGWIGIDNTWYRTDASDGNPSAGTNETFTFTDDEAQNLQVYIANGTSTDVHVANFGQDGTFANGLTGGDVGTNTDATGRGAFKHAPPTGFLACCSANLPNVEIGPNSSTQADDYFDIDAYSGSASNQTRTLNFQADWMWFKERTTAGIQHQLFDSSRLHSTSNAKFGRKLDIAGSTLSAEGDSTAIVSQSGNDVTLSGGVSTVNDQYSRTYVNWHWKANGGNTSSNTQGSKTSTVQANTTAGFSIVLYSGDTSSFTVGHGLKFAPEWVIVKSRTDAERWAVFHTSVPNEYNYLNDTFVSQTGNADERFGNSTSVVVPNSTVVTLGANNSDVSENGDDYVMYCFHSVEGYSKFGSYTGNGDADGACVFTGFRPAWLMIRSTTSGRHWVIKDSARNTSNVMSNTLLANSTTSQDTSTSFDVDFLSNGFKCRTSLAHVNTGGEKHLYMAFAEQPFKFSNAR